MSDSLLHYAEVSSHGKLNLIGLAQALGLDNNSGIDTIVNLLNNSNGNFQRMQQIILDQGYRIVFETGTKVKDIIFCDDGDDLEM